LSHFVLLHTRKHRVSCYPAFGSINQSHQPEQTQGGVPKMFIEALDKYGDCNGNRNNDDGDDVTTTGRNNHSHKIVRRLSTADKILGTSDNPVICID